MRRHKFKLASFAVILFIGWVLAPQIAVWSMSLASKKGEESSQNAHDRIVFFGERAIQPTIASIEEHSPWTRRYCYLPSALQKIGGSAHKDLLAAIDNQDDATKRSYLISSLQSAFGDYSQFQTIIEDCEAKRISEGTLMFFQSNISISFPDAPQLLTIDRKLNNEFKIYWKTISEQGGASNP